MFNTIIDTILDMFAHLFGSLAYRTERAKKRRQRKKSMFPFTRRVSERGMTVDGSRGVTRKWK